MNWCDSNDRDIEIPTWMETVTQDEQDKLLEKQFQARVWLGTNPFANAMRAKIKAIFNQRIKLKDRVVLIR